MKIYQNVRKLCTDSVYKREEGNSIFSKNIPRVPVVKSLRRNSDSFAGTTIVEIAHQSLHVFIAASCGYQEGMQSRTFASIFTPSTAFYFLDEETLILEFKIKE